MKKLLSIILSATMLLGVVGCGSANNNAETTASTDKIIVGLDDQFPPMGFRDDKNELVGFDIDLAKAAAEKMGCKIEFQPIDWDSKEMELNTGKISLIWNGLDRKSTRLNSSHAL